MIQLYYMDMDCDCSGEQSQVFFRILPEERREKINRLKNETLAKKKLLSSVMMQYVLAKRLEIPIEQLRYSYGADGKPEIDYAAMKRLLPEAWQNCPRCFFNLSHSGKYAVLAVSETAVGIDVEHVRKNRLSVAKRCFHPEEYQDIIRQSTEREQEYCFLEYWTMKESYIKRTGLGLRQPLNSFCIERGEGALSRVRDEDIYFATFWLDEDYCVSLCGEEKEFLSLCDREYIIEVKMEEIKVKEDVK